MRWLGYSTGRYISLGVVAHPYLDRAYLYSITLLARSIVEVGELGSGIEERNRKAL
jgi:hypothetical protein